MIIYFLRHANAGQHKVNPLQDDKRPLDAEGIQQCTIIGRVLAAMDVQVDAIISSPLKRATQTASLVGNEIGHDSKLQTSAALKPNASFDSFRQLLNKYTSVESIMVVGHNPSMNHFLSLMLSAGSSDDVSDLKKGAVARVDVSGNRTAILKWCITPKIVRAIQDATPTNSRPKTDLK
ncbi:MAG: phosphohistidine phosphatase SixA [Acidobacteriaceae bacterium]|nr:phosphohistidine phosphatase SixA [Acidobacteriaceae bacterium]